MNRPKYGAQTSCERCGQDVEFVGTTPHESPLLAGMDLGNGWWDRGGNYHCTDGHAHNGAR